MNMNYIEKGNVIWLYLRPSTQESYMQIKHPYLVINVTDFVIEVLQLDTFDKGRRYRATKSGGLSGTV